MRRINLPVIGKDTLFDERPIEVGGFALRSREVWPLPGVTPTLDGWAAALQLAGAAQDSSPFWVGDLLEYAETRADWREKLEQAKTVTKLAHHTLQNLTSISRKVKGRARELAPSLSHAAVVTALEPEEQERLLEEARDGGWTVNRLSKAVSIAKRSTVLEGQAETMHTVDVTVRIVCEAETPYAAEQAAWAVIKTAVSKLDHTHVIAAHAAPHVGIKKGRRPRAQQASARESRAGGVALAL